MLRQSLSSPQLMNEVARSLTSRNGNGSLTFYQSIRRSTSRFHEHLTYSKLNTKLPRKNVVDPKILKKGHPVSASLAMGDMAKTRKFEFNVASLNARGFLRFQKAYTPPGNAAQKVFDVCRTTFNSTEKEEELVRRSINDPKVKYELLTKTFEEFQHGIPNSMLHMMNTVGDVVQFYCTPVNTNTPYEELIRNQDDLPPNLHVQKEPIRFHPDTDTMFGGQSAFTKSSTIVTGLRAKKKYRGYEAKMTWP